MPRKSKAQGKELGRKSKNLNQTMINGPVGKNTFKTTPTSLASGLNTTLNVGGGPNNISASIPKKLKGTLISLGPQTNKEIASRKFDFDLSYHQLASTKNAKDANSSLTHTRKKSGAPQASIAKMKGNKMHVENRMKNKSFDVGNKGGNTSQPSQVEFEPVINSNNTNKNKGNANATQIYGGSNSSKTVRDPT